MLRLEYSDCALRVASPTHRSNKGAFLNASARHAPKTLPVQQPQKGSDLVNTPG